MSIFLVPNELDSQFQRIKQAQQILNAQIMGFDKQPAGISDMRLYRMKKEYSQLQDQFTKIKSSFHPDIIA